MLYLYFGVACICGILFYIRRQIQGYYRDYKAILPKKIDLNGKTALITGGNSGIGLGTAIHLAKLQCNIIIACRNADKAAKSVEYIKSQSGNQSVSSLNLDLSDISSIESCASIINKNDNIDIDYLILNAGIGSSAATSSSSKQGLSLLFQTNYFGHFILTNLLLNKIKQTANKRWNEIGNKYGSPVRIVCVSSGAHSSATIPLDNNKWENMTKYDCSYGQSKLLQILHMKQLQKELNCKGYDSKIQCVSITPGLVRTNIINTFSPIVYCLIMLIYPLWWYLSRDIMMGSQVVLHVCGNTDIVSGGYYSNCRLKQSKGKNGCSNDTELWQQVWNKSKLLLQFIQNRKT